MGGCTDCSVSYARPIEQIRNNENSTVSGASHYHGDALVGTWVVVPHCIRVNCSSSPLFRTRASLFPFGMSNEPCLHNVGACNVYKSAPKADLEELATAQPETSSPRFPSTTVSAQTHSSCCRFHNFCTAPWDFTFAVIS
jgi:hypothetical protein